MSARNQQRREQLMSTDTLIQYAINAALFGFATGAAAAIIALFVAPK